MITDVYPKFAKRLYQNSGPKMPAYTILLGDYNAELDIEDDEVALNAIIKRNDYRKKNKISSPAVIPTDKDKNTGKKTSIINSDKYDMDVRTVQYELTTLKKKENTEEFLDRGYASNYERL